MRPDIHLITTTFNDEEVATMRDVAGVLAPLVDACAGALSALWPRSVTGREASRLARDGHAIGAFHEVMFAVSFDESPSDAAIEAVRAAGFTLRDESGALSQWTVLARMPLSPYHLHVTSASLGRVLASYGGFAVLIGPVRRVPRVAGTHGFAGVESFTA